MKTIYSKVAVSMAKMRSGQGKTNFMGKLIMNGSGVELKIDNFEDVGKAFDKLTNISTASVIGAHVSKFFDKANYDAFTSKHYKCVEPSEKKIMKVMEKNGGSERRKDETEAEFQARKQKIKDELTKYKRTHPLLFGTKELTSVTDADERIISFSIENLEADEISKGKYILYGLPGKTIVMDMLCACNVDCVQQGNLTVLFPLFTEYIYNPVYFKRNPVIGFHKLFPGHLSVDVRFGQRALRQQVFRLHHHQSLRKVGKNSPAF